MTIEKRDVMFKSGEAFAAWLFLPDQARSGRRVPAVAMAHRFGAVKEMYLEPFARRFAAAGIAALVFDYGGFGASGGEPGQRVLPPIRWRLSQRPDLARSSRKSMRTGWASGAPASAAPVSSGSPPMIHASRRWSVRSPHGSRSDHS